METDSYYRLFEALLFALLFGGGSIFCVRTGFKMGRQTQGVNNIESQIEQEETDQGSIVQDVDPWEEASVSYSATSTVPDK